jgi:hypothetical protein
VRFRSVAEGNSDSLRGLHQLAVGIDCFQFADGLGDIYRANALAAQAHHLAESAFRDPVHGRDAKASGQDAVVRRGRAAALNVAVAGHWTTDHQTKDY